MRQPAPNRWQSLVLALAATCVLAGGAGCGSSEPGQAVQAEQLAAPLPIDEPPAQPAEEPAAEAPAEPRPAEAAPEPAPVPARAEPRSAPQPRPQVEAAAPASAMPAASRGRGMIEWGRTFLAWDVVSGFVLSASHGQRLVRAYVYPAEAARIYEHNATLARRRETEGFRSYPTGTQIVLASWTRNDVGGAGESGPVFFMRKEPPGHDAEAGDWHFAMARNDLSVLGEGRNDGMGFCLECHARAAARDYVYAHDR